MRTVILPLTIHLLTVVCGTTAAPVLPAYSTATLPVFWHAANASGLLNETMMDFVLQFPLVTIEKYQSQYVAPVNDTAETKIIAQAAAIKAAAASQGRAAPMVLFYLNAVMNWNMYSFSRQVPEALLVKLPNGTLATIFGQTVFDLRQPAMVDMWLGLVREVFTTSAGAVDGIFADRGFFPIPPQWNFSAADAANYTASLASMVQAAQSIVEGRGVVVLNNADTATDAGRMFERWGYLPLDYDNLGPLADMADLERLGTIPHVAEAHGGEPCNATFFNQTLAQFLVSAGPYAYYACSDGWIIDEGWDVWYTEYSQPLGAPLGAATNHTSADGTVTFFRRFASGTNATFSLAADALSAAACICWASGWVTGPAGCCQT
jgi:Hypothetical glycosyl hydrolase family 15